MAETTRYSRYFPVGFGHYVRFAVTSGPPIIWRPRIDTHHAESAIEPWRRSARVLRVGIGWWIFYAGIFVEEATRCPPREAP